MPNISNSSLSLYLNSRLFNSTVSATRLVQKKPTNNNIAFAQRLLRSKNSVNNPKLSQSISYDNREMKRSDKYKELLSIVNKEDLNQLNNPSVGAAEKNKVENWLKKVATFSKLYSRGSPNEAVEPANMKIPDDFESVDIKTWPDNSHLKFVLKFKGISDRWVLNKNEILVYRQDNRPLKEIIAAGGFYPRTETIGTIEDHTLGSTKDYSYVSTSAKRLRGGSFGKYEYAIILKPGQAVDVEKSLNKAFQHNDPTLELSVPGIINPDQIKGWRNCK